MVIPGVLLCVNQQMYFSRSIVSQSFLILTSLKNISVFAEGLILFLPAVATYVPRRKSSGELQTVSSLFLWFVGFS